MHSRLLASCLIVLSLFLGCHHDGEPSAPLERTGAAAQVNNGPVTDQLDALSLPDSLVGFSVSLVKPLFGATLNVATTSFTVPSGAVLAPQWISYTVVRKTPPPGMLDMPRRVFRFHPDGLVFLRPCQLIVPFDELELGAIDPSTLTCCYYNPVTLTYEPQPTVVDLQGRRFIVQINHFSQYGFGRLQ